MSHSGDRVLSVMDGKAGCARNGGGGADRPLEGWSVVPCPGCFPVFGSLPENGSCGRPPRCSAQPGAHCGTAAPGRVVTGAGLRLYRAVLIIPTRGREESLGGVSRRGGAEGQMRRRRTRRMEWSGPLRRTRPARPRVGAMFSRRLRSLMSRHTFSANVVASSCDSSARCLK